MTDFRTQGDNIDRTTVHHIDDRRGSSTIYFILGGVVALLAVLWFAFSGAPAVDPGQPAPVTIENNAAPAAPAAPEATITPDAATPDVAPVTPAPEAAPVEPAPVTPAPAE